MNCGEKFLKKLDLVYIEMKVSLPEETFIVLVKFFTNVVHMFNFKHVKFNSKRFLRSDLLSCTYNSLRLPFHI